MARKAATDETECLSIWFNKSFSKALKRRRIRSLPLIWTGLTGIEPPFQAVLGAGGVSVKKVVIENTIKTTGYSLKKDKSNYISACYDILLNTLGEHAKCFNLIVEWVNQFDYSLIMRGYRKCAQAHAFLIWRMYWEGLNMPRGLAPIDQIQRYRYLYVTHFPDQFFDVLSAELFEATFKEAVLLCKHWQRKKLLSLDYRYMSLRLCPYWVVKKRASEPTITELIVWRDRFLSRQSNTRYTTEHFENLRRQLVSTFVQ